MPVLTKINTNSIAEDAITGDKFAGDAYLSNTATQNISGTYSENRLYTSDAYTLSGNATVNSHLTLSSVKPTADVVLTAGGAYTLTGSGVLSGGSLLAKERTDLTGMTGEVGSVVTGSPNLNLGNATFPEGKVNQTKSIFVNDVLTVTCGSSYVDLPNFNVEITPTSTSSKILVMLNMGTFNFSSTNYGISGAGQLRRKIASGSFSAIGIGKANSTWNASFNLPQPNSYMYHSVHCIFLDSPNTTSVCTYGIALVDHNGNTQTFYLNQTGAVAGGEQNEMYSQSYGSSLIVQEIVG